MKSNNDHNLQHNHNHEHDDAHSQLPTEPELRVKAIETLRLRKGLIESEKLEGLIDT